MNKRLGSRYAKKIKYISYTIHDLGNRTILAFGSVFMVKYFRKIEQYSHSAKKEETASYLLTQPVTHSVNQSVHMADSVPLSSLTI